MILSNISLLLSSNSLRPDITMREGRWDRSTRDVRPEPRSPMTRTIRSPRDSKTSHDQDGHASTACELRCHASEEHAARSASAPPYHDQLVGLLDRVLSKRVGWTPGQKDDLRPQPGGIRRSDERISRPLVLLGETRPGRGS